MASGPTTVKIPRGFFGLTGTPAQEEGRATQPPQQPLHSSAIVTDSVSIFAVAERGVAHFKARLAFRLTTPGLEVANLQLVLPSANLIVYYLQASIGSVSIYRLGIQHETSDSLVYSFGQQKIRSSVLFTIRGSFRYTENPAVGLVTLIFPNLAGDQQGKLSMSERRLDEDAGRDREQSLSVHCLLSLPAPFRRFIGSQGSGNELRIVSPDACRVFLRYGGSCDVHNSVEFSVACNCNPVGCPNILLHHPPLGLT